MSSSVSSGIKLGRPFGGTGFLYAKKYSKCLKHLINFTHERVTAMELSTKNGNIIIINAYMPFYNTCDYHNYLAMYQEVVGQIDSIMHTHTGSSFIITADFNCNIFDGTHPYSLLIRHLMAKYDLVSTFDSMPGFNSHTSFTRSDVKTNSFTLIDGILISRNLLPTISNVRISNNGGNVSDHVPVEIDISVDISELILKPERKLGQTLR